MEPATFYLFVVLTIGIFLLEFVRPSGYLQLPFMFSAVCLGWVIPQVIAIREDQIHEADLAVFNLMATLCLLMTLAGWRLALSRQNVASNRIPVRGSFDQRRMGRATALLTVIAIIAMGAVAMRPLEERLSTMPTGPVTILLFIANIKVLSLGFSLILFLRRPIAGNVLLLSLNCLIYMPLVILYFRRASMAEFAQAIVIALWFARGYLVSRSVIAAGLIGATLLVFSTGKLRDLARGSGDDEWTIPNITDIADIDFLSYFRTEGAVAAAPEVLNAVNLVRLADFGGFTLGAETWNRFIFQFIPAQVVGDGLKASLMVNTALRERLLYEMNHNIVNGSTYTGIGTAYLEFGLLGAIYFFVWAYILGRFWVHATKGDIWSQGLYISCLVPALITLTHHCGLFLNSLVFFLGTTILIKKTIPRTRQTSPESVLGPRKLSPSGSGRDYRRPLHASFDGDST